MDEMKNIFKIFGQNVQNARIEKGITLDELSQKTGIRKQYLIKIEKGEAVRITASHLFIIAEGLNVKASILAKGL